MAMTTTLDDLITTICPELDASPSRDVYVDIAKSTLSAEALGDVYNLAVALKASHEYTIDTVRSMGQPGKVIGMTEGRTSIQYEMGQNVRPSSSLSMTQYGARLKDLYRSQGLVASGV